jgi:class 3 adenylate cyclase
MEPAQSPVRKHSDIAMLFFRFSVADESKEHGIHLDADSLLTAYRPHAVKIKTVGNLIIAAGPLDAAKRDSGECSVETSTAALARLAMALARSMTAHGAVYRGGLHVGDVVAAVMGTVRLTFDIFGDAMNTCSRVMSTSEPNTVTCSAAFIEPLQRADAHSEPECSPGVVTPADAVTPAEAVTAASPTDSVPPTDAATMRSGLSSELRLGPSEERAAKGKGTVTVRCLLHKEDAQFEAAFAIGASTPQ